MRKDKILKAQKKTFLLVVAPIVIVTAAFAYFVIENDQPREIKKEKKLDLPTDSFNPQESWNIRTNDQIAVLDQKVGFIESLLMDSKEREAKANKEKHDLLNEIEELKKEVAKNAESKEVFVRSEPASFDPFSYSEEFIQTPEYEPRKCLTIKQAEFSRELVKNVDRTIPSGTTVKAVMVSSVDAPCGAYSSVDPQPVKLQILDDGHLPKNVRAKLKGGIIIASAYGDLSSERLYLRIERLTQVKSSGDFVETTVTGFITGEDGKYGVRGSVVDRSAKLVENAAISGLFSGANSFFQAYASSRFCNFGYGGCAPYAKGGGDSECSPKEFGYGLATYGGTEGIGNAFDTLTDYYIRRAELVKPVIQVNAGRIVDITFTLGTEIGDLNAQDACERIREKSRRNNA